MSNILIQKIQKANKIAITGHINPDGDCVGSVLGMASYIRSNFEGRDVRTFIYNVPPKFAYLAGYDQIRTELTADDDNFDLLILLDCAAADRIGQNDRLTARCKDSICIDHHLTNDGFAAENIIEPYTSSTSEVLFYLMDEDKINKDTAECLYTGIVHDTGVFKYASVTKKTMVAAGALMEKGIDFTEIIDGSFYRHTFPQQKATGYALVNSKRNPDGRIIYSYMSAKTKAEFGANSSDLDGISESLRNTDGVDTSIFASELNPRQYKISMRSINIVDVSIIAQAYNGGGHVRAAGCTIVGDIDKILESLIAAAQQQLDAYDAANSENKTETCCDKKTDGE